MPSIHPFRAIHPTPAYVSRVPICHGDAATPERIREVVGRNPINFLTVTNAESTLSPEDAADDAKVRSKTKELLRSYFDRGILTKDATDRLYIWRICREDHTQTGLVACLDMAEYLEGRVLKHELTRTEKRAHQRKLLENVGGSFEPVQLVFDASEEEQTLLKDCVDGHTPDSEFTDANGTFHQVWAVTDPEEIARLQAAFSRTEKLYICDGHHRIAAAAEYAADQPDPGAVRFMAILFPAAEMKILDYNRAVRDLGPLSGEDFLRALREQDFTVEAASTEPIAPHCQTEYTMVMDGTWYRLTYRGDVDCSDPVASLGVSILQDKVLRDILGIVDPQNDERLVFISGNKGLGALQEAAETDCKVAFAIAPVSIRTIMDVADAGLTMPPKSTYFDPKPLGGLLIHEV